MNHLKIIGIRVLVTIMIATGLPLFYLLWFLSLDAGAQREIGEQAAYSFMYAGVVGFTIAGVFVGLGSVTHAVARRKPRVVFWTDVALGLIALACAIGGAMSAMLMGQR